MAGHDSQLLKGVLSLLVLRLLQYQEDYGYSIVLRLQHHGFHDLAEGTVYPALTRLEKRGLLNSKMVKSANGPARKYYRLTQTGESELAATTQSWNELTLNVEAVLHGVELNEPSPTPTDSEVLT